MNFDEYTISDIPLEFLDRLDPARRKVAADCGYVDFDAILADSEGVGELAESAKLFLERIEPYAVRSVIRQLMDQAEEERLNHINNPEWQEKHRNDPAQILARNYRLAVFESDANERNAALRAAKEQCDSLDGYRAEIEELNCMDYDDDDMDTQLDEIEFLAEKTGQLDLLESVTFHELGLYVS